MPKSTWKLPPDKPLFYKVELEKVDSENLQLKFNSKFQKALNWCKNPDSDLDTKNLIYLNISSDIDEKLGEVLSEQFINNQKVGKVTFFANKMSDAIANKIATAISKNSSITEVEFLSQKERISSEAMTDIIKILSNMPNLSHLAIIECGLNNEGVENLVSLIKSSSTLETLDLARGFPLTDNCVIANQAKIVEAIENSPSITETILKFNDTNTHKVHVAEARNFITLIKSAEELYDVTIPHNLLEPQYALTIAKALELKGVTKVNVTKTVLIDSVPTTISNYIDVDDFINKCKLTYVSLEVNESEVPIEISSNIEETGILGDTIAENFTN